MRNKDAKGSMLTSAIVIVLTLLFIYAVIKLSGVEARADGLVLKGLYGRTVPYTSMTSAELYDADLPASMVRVNGVSLGFLELGHYRLKDMGSVLLFILKRQKPYLLLRTSTETILLGLGAEKNRELLERIRAGGGPR